MDRERVVRNAIIYVLAIVVFLVVLYVGTRSFPYGGASSPRPRNPPPPVSVDSSIALDSSVVTVDSVLTTHVPEPIAGVALRPFAEGTNWMLTEPLVYRVGDSRDSVVVPKGFVTDFASIPPRLQGLISALGPYMLPAVVHDYLYWEQRCTRAQADRLFLIAMQEMRVPFDRRWPMYEAVNGFGGGAWTQNGRDRRAGLPRIVPDGVRRNEALESWRSYRAYLRTAGVRPGPPAEISQRFCAHGS
jgi:hypothetical protein